MHTIKTLFEVIVYEHVCACGVCVDRVIAARSQKWWEMVAAVYPVVGRSLPMLRGGGGGRPSMRPSRIQMKVLGN